MTGQMDDLQQQFQGLLDEAYKRGFEAGKDAMLQSILKAADVPVAPQQQQATKKRTFKGRAPKGAVGKLTQRVLSETPGLPIVEIENRILEINPEISRKSVGNELRRLEGERYRREDRNWFLIGNAEKETAETAGNDDSAASSDTNQGGSLWSRPS